MTMAVPDFHFIFGLREQTEPLHIAHYLALESCRQLNAPPRIHFHYRNEPWGPWWDRIRPHLTLRPVTGRPQGFDPSQYAATEEGRIIEHYGWSYAHEADFIRLQVLFDEGGIYADMDTLFVRPYPDFASLSGGVPCEFAVAEEQAHINSRGVAEPSLCNAVLIAPKPGARFAALWLQRMREDFDGTWSKHSCQAAARLQANAGSALTILPRRYFFYYGSDARGLDTLFKQAEDTPREVYSIHLWSHLWWDTWRNDFIDFHHDSVTELHIREVDSTYNRVARRFLP